MSRALETLAREKEILVMRSALCRLRLRLHAQQARASTALRITGRVVSVARFAGFLAGARALRSIVRYRTDGRR